MKKGEGRATKFVHQCDEGNVLLAALMLIFLVGILGMTSLHLAAQDGPGISSMKEDNVAQQLADGAADVAMSWFHDSSATPTALAGLLAKRQGDPGSGPSFFDAAGRSQFVGTADRPDIMLDAANQADNQTLNGSSSGFPNALGGLGRILKLKVYGPLQPGLLSTVEVTAMTVDHRPITRTVQLQLGAVKIPAVRAAAQVGQTLGAMQPGGESPIMVHWGDQRILGDLTVQRVEDLALKRTEAPVTGQSYGEMLYAQDRWTEYWIGGTVSVIAPPPGQGVTPPLPENVHLHQYPSPGVRLDQWDCDSLKKIALRWGTYYRLDRAGSSILKGPRILIRESRQQMCWNLRASETIVDWSSSTPSMGNRHARITWGRWYWRRTMSKACWSCKAMWCAGLVRPGNQSQFSVHLHREQNH